MKVAELINKKFNKTTKQCSNNIDNEKMEMQKQRVLLVDDSPENIDILDGLLTDYKKQVAINGEKALSILESDDIPDLVLLDIKMPGIDGFEVCKKMRADKKFNNVPIIFLTALTERDKILKGFELGGQDYVTKPFDKEELLARVKTQLELKMHKDRLEDLVAQRTEELQKAYEELEVLDNAKAEFLGMLSHEIRTPLNGIFGFLELLKLKADSDELKVFVSHLNTSAKRLEDFSMKALDITILRTKQYRVQLVKVDVVKKISTAIEHFRNEFNEKNIEVRFDCSNSILAEVDSPLFLKIIEEFFRNILLHSPDTTFVDVKAEVIQNELNIVVSDNGKGFSTKALDNIFKPFGIGQAHINDNTGLGLHFVKLACETLGIKVEAGNNNTGGAFVRLSMPM